MKALAKMLSLSFAIIVFSTLVIQACQHQVQESTPTSKKSNTKPTKQNKNNG